MVWLSVICAWLGSSTLPPNFEAAQKLAQDQKKPLVVYFHAYWCQGCKYFDSHLKDGKLDDVLEKVILFKAECTDQDNPTFVADCRHVGFPTFHIYQNGKVQESWISSNASMFRNQVEHYLAGTSYIKTLENSFNKMPTEENGKALAKAYSELEQYQKSLTVREQLYQMNPTVERRVKVLDLKDMMVFKGRVDFLKMLAEYEAFIAGNPESKGNITWAIDRIFWITPEDRRMDIMPKYWAMLQKINPEELPEGGYPFKMRHIFTSSTAAGHQGDLARGYHLIADIYGEQHSVSLQYRAQYNYRLDTLLDDLARFEKESTKQHELKNFRYYSAIAALKKDPVQGWATFQKYLGPQWRDKPEKLGTLVYTAEFANVAVNQALEHADHFLDLLEDPDELRRYYSVLMTLAIRQENWQKLEHLLQRAQKEECRHSYFDYWAATYLKGKTKPGK